MIKNNNKGFLSLFIITIAVFISSCNNNTPKKELSTVSSGTVNIVVDESLQPLVEAEIQAFESVYPKASITAKYLPETEAINLLLKDSAKLAVLARPLTKEEKEIIKKQKIYTQSTLVGRGAICLITNKKNPDSTLSLIQLRKLFNGAISTWKQLNEKGLNDSIQLIFANKNASTVKYIKDSISEGELPKIAFALGENGKVIDYVSKHKHAMGIIGVSWISDKNSETVRGFLNKINVMGISRTGYDAAYEPFQAFIANTKYALIRKIYIESREARTGLATGFSSYIAGQKGQSVILKGGLVPATMPVRIVEFKN